MVGGQVLFLEHWPLWAWMRRAQSWPQDSRAIFDKRSWSWPTRSFWALELSWFCCYEWPSLSSLLLLLLLLLLELFLALAFQQGCLGRRHGGGFSGFALLRWVEWFTPPPP